MFSYLYQKQYAPHRYHLCSAAVNVWNVCHCYSFTLFCFVGNVLKEIVEPVGAEIFADKFQLGDPTISILELWGAEYQESNALLSMPENRKVLESISQRERCPINFIGTVTGDKKVSLKKWLILNFIWTVKPLWQDGKTTQARFCICVVFKWMSLLECGLSHALLSPLLKCIILFFLFIASTLVLYQFLLHQGIQWQTS